MNQLKK